MNPEGAIQPKTERLSSNAVNGVEKQEVAISPESSYFEIKKELPSSSEVKATFSDSGLLSTIPVLQDDSVVASDQISSSIVSVNDVVDDDKLIDRVWVDKAKAIIADTKNDPYIQKNEVVDLQNDYLKTTLGRSLSSVDK